MTSGVSLGFKYRIKDSYLTIKACTHNKFKKSSVFSGFDRRDPLYGGRFRPSLILIGYKRPCDYLQGSQRLSD